MASCLTEIARNSSVFVRMNGNQTILEKPTKDEKGPKEEDIKAFTFDRSFWSVDKADVNYAGQEVVYKDLGEDLLEHAFDGYNCCIFACKLDIDSLCNSVSTGLFIV
jgi:kinesin family protein 1